MMCMNATKALSPASEVRRGVLLAIAVCLVFHWIMFSGYLDFIWPRFVPGDLLFTGSIMAETVIIFCIFYRTPLFAQKAGLLARVGRVAKLVVVAHCLIWGVMVAVMILWFVACALLGVPPRNA